MIRLTESSEFSSQGGYPPDRNLRNLRDVADGDCVPAAVLREAHRIADKYPPAKARQLLRELFFATCASVLGKGDREELLQDFLAERERSRLAFLDGLGLVRDWEIPGRYLPGSWWLSNENDGQDCWCVINGVRATSGEFVVVRLTAAQFMRAGESLQAIRKAVGAAEHIGLTATEWQRIWNGFDVRGPYGVKRWSQGLRSSLNEVAR